MELSKEAQALIGLESIREYAVDKRTIKRYAQAIGDKNPLYYDEDFAKTTRHQGIVAPPLFFQSLTYDDLPVDELDQDGSPPELNVPIPAKRAVGGSSQYELFERARPGDKITVKSKLNRIYTKEGRSGLLYFIEVITEFINAKSTVMARETATYIKRV